MMLASREAVVNYMTPLGLAHQMARSHHYGPGPWVSGGRADQTSVYFNRADSGGLGFDRTASGSNAVRQYAPPLRNRFASRDSVPDALLLWFHHVGWSERLRSGRTLWEELLRHYQAGVDTVRSMQRTWDGLADRVDGDAFAAVPMLAQRGGAGVTLHGAARGPSGPAASERDRIVKQFKAALQASGMKVPMATTNLFSDPVFRDGAFTSNDARVRAYAIRKTMAAIDLGVELGAATYVMWGGREGVETNAGKDPRAALDRKSTRLNSSHSQISYAVFCLNKQRHSPSDPHQDAPWQRRHFPGSARAAECPNRSANTSDLRSACSPSWRDG